MPMFGSTASAPSVPFTRGLATLVRGFILPPLHPQGVLVVSGLTADPANVPIAGVTVELFDAITNALVATTVSDINGIYSFPVLNGAQPYFLVGYKAGAGAIVINLFGTTDIVVATAA